ncbi:MAG TPA: PAS domain S-box protein [Allocoleopsis sp.]
MKHKPRFITIGMSHLRKKADLRPSMLMNSKGEQWQPRADQALPKSTAELETFQTLYETLPGICFTLNLAGKILLVSEVAAACLGYTPTELTQKFIASIFHPEDRDKCQAKLTALQQSAQISQWQARLVGKNGHIIWIKALARLVPRPQSSPIISLVCEDITAHKQMEEKLRESEARYRAAAQGSLDAFFIFQSVRDEEGEIIDFTFAELNANAEKMIAMSREEAIGQRLCELLPINRTGGFFEKYVRVVETGMVLEEEFPISTPEIKASWLQHQVVPLQDGIAITSRDISDRKAAEQALLESEACFRATFFSATVGMSHCAPTGEFLRVNQKFCDIVGYTQEELLARTLQDITVPDDWDVNRDRERSLLEGDIPNYLMENRYIRKDGQIVWVEQTVSVVWQPTGEPKYCVVVVTDISDRKLAEAEIRQTRNFLQTTIDYLPVAVFVKDGKAENFGAFRLWNKTSERMFGLTAEQAIGKTVHDFFPKEQADFFEQKDRDAFERGTPEDILEEPIDSYSLGRRILHTIKVPLYDENHEPQYLLCISEDITERKQAEDALRQQYLKERLVATIAARIHESLNLEEILNTTVAEVRQFLGCDRAIVFHLESDGSGVVVVESAGSEWRPISGTTINDRYFAETYVELYQQGRVQAVEDIYTAGLTPCHLDLLARFQVRANLVVPIVYEEKLWGLLVAQQCGEPRQWQPLEIDLLKSLATQAAIAIQQSELYQQAQTEIIQRQQTEAALQQQYQRERLVGAIAQRIRQSLDLEKILERTAAEVRQVLQTDRVILFRFNPDWSGDVVVESVDEHWIPILGTNIYDPCFSKSYVSFYQQGRVRTIEDIQTAHLNQCHVNLLAQFQVRANLVVPILQSETLQNPKSDNPTRLWGLLIAHHCSQPRQWQQFEIDLLSALAAQVAIAIQQAELYEQSRRATAQAQTQAQQLEQTLSELQKTQSHLVQSEKMSSLGQLVAGVAHEINNPVSFIYGNLSHATGYIQDLLGLIQRYQQHYPNPKPDIQLEIEAIDLDFLVEDLPKILDSMRVGAERICEIVYSLRNFSRVAEAEMKAVDIHEGLDSTLVILQNRLKASGKHPKIEVIKDYGNLPTVECYAGPLNQVFMNLLTNAIDAIDEQNQTRTPEELDANPSIIRVRTEALNNNWVAIRIADNGPGMTEQVKSRLFDPFFTTKPVGAGTGLGLSISYQIVVEKHRGKLYCFSELGKGTEFVIQIPRSQNPQN